MKAEAAQTVYFDYNATTPLDGGVFESMLPMFGKCYGNASSVHRVGREARVSIDDARDRISRVLKCKPSELVFTSGGTESNNFAVFGAARKLKPKGNHLITSAIEHHAVLSAISYLAEHEGFQVSILQCDAMGRIDPDDLARSILPSTVLVSIQAANNEIGTVQDVAAMGRVCRERGVLFHTDAVQVFGKREMCGIGELEADLVSVCGHKFHGPKGSGLLYVRSPFQPHSLLVGGAHENERRAGTENGASILGLATAVERFVPSPVFNEAHLSPLLNRIRSGLGDLDPELVQIHTPKDGSLVNTIAFTVADSDSMTLMANLDLLGICASSGSACAAGSLEPSHVIRALGCSDARAQALIRLSLGRESTVDETEYVLRSLPEVIRRSRQ